MRSQLVMSLHNGRLVSEVNSRLSKLKINPTDVGCQLLGLLVQPLVLDRVATPHQCSLTDWGSFVTQHCFMAEAVGGSAVPSSMRQMCSSVI